MEIVPPVLVGIFILIAVGAVIRHLHLKEKERVASLMQWASGLGLHFEERENSHFEDRFPEFACFRQGNNRYALNVATGTFEGRRVHTFDYHFATQSTTTDSKGQTRTTTHHHCFSGVILESTLLLKPLLIRPEGLFDTVANFFGKNDIDFESADFSRRYHVSSDDRRWAYDVLHARTIQRLLDQPPHTIEFAPQRVLVLREQRRMDVDDFHGALTLIDGVLDDLPEYVVQQQREVHL